MGEVETTVGARDDVKPQLDRIEAKLDRLLAASAIARADLDDPPADLPEHTGASRPGPSATSRKRYGWELAYGAAMHAAPGVDVLAYLGVDAESSTAEERGEAIDAVLRGYVAGGKAVDRVAAIPHLVRDAAAAGHRRGRDDAL